MNKLTGFRPDARSRLTPIEVRRAFQMATLERAKVMAKTAPLKDFDYVAAVEFLRICAAHKLALVPDEDEVPPNPRERRQHRRRSRRGA